MGSYADISEVGAAKRRVDAAWSLGDALRHARLAREHHLVDEQQLVRGCCSPLGVVSIYFRVVLWVLCSPPGAHSVRMVAQ